MQTLDKATLDSLVASCSGDIRGAINALQFTCRQGKFSTNIFRAFMVILGTVIVGTMVFVMFSD